jgi:hypothetical protein
MRKEILMEIKGQSVISKQYHKSVVASVSELTGIPIEYTPPVDNLDDQSDNEMLLKEFLDTDDVGSYIHDLHHQIAKLEAQFVSESRFVVEQCMELIDMFNDDINSSAQSTVDLAKTKRARLEFVDYFGTLIDTIHLKLQYDLLN